MAFFTYGIFKPVEIAYSKIRDLVIDKNEVMVEYPMKHRDGVPILIKGNKHNISQTKGYILNFKDNQEAYRIISQTISNSLYEWGIIIIGEEK